jgi:transposase InsO family protein
MKPTVEEVDDVDSIRAHDELTDRSETPIPKFLSKEKGTHLEHGSGRSEGEAAASSPRGPREAENPAARPEPWSASWFAHRFRDQPYERAIGLLRTAVHSKRHLEATREVLEQLNALSLDEATEAISELRGPKRYIRGSQGGNSLLMSAALTTIDDRRTFGTRALIDSGCTGSTIDAGFVAAKGINTHKLARPIPVYNADGTLNAGGAISHYVVLQLNIHEHTERLVLGVANLGKGELFIGHEWLKHHNPSIDWTAGTLVFDRCPKTCAYTHELYEPEATEEDEQQNCVSNDPEVKLEEGERLFAFDFDSYSREGSTRIRAHTTTSQQLAEEVSRSRTEKTFEEMIPESYRDFEEVFKKESFDELPPRKPWDHAIELVPGEHVIDCKVYNLSPGEQRELDAFLEENLRSGRIRLSKSPIASPFFFVKKKDGKLRPVQDYRKLNASTIKNRYPLPLIQELVGKLKGAKHFTKLDIRWGYNNVRIKEGDEWKAAFLTNRGLYEPLVMFFGLTNSPATFQTMMNDIFRDLINDGKVVIYLDDILIFTKDLEEHRQITRRVLQILQENKLYLKPEKCEFEKTEIEYLGLVILEGQVHMDPVKVNGILDWPVPTMKRELQAFLGFVNFYRRFIRGYGDLSKPLTSLTGNADWSWGSEQSGAFEEIKCRVSSAPVLAIPTDDDPYRLEADSSGKAIGAVLSQCQDGVWKPVAFLSKSLNETERNYEIYDRELLAIMTALAEWRHHLMGAANDFEIWTDHQNLGYFKKPQKLNRRQARWVTELANYHFTLHHKPGKTNQKADLLSRRADHETGEKDNENVTMLKPETFWKVELVSEDDDFLARSRRRHANRDAIVTKKLILKEKGWAEADNLVMWKGRVYIPIDRKLREDIIRKHHDSTLAGHPGRYKTHELITRDYWWPRILSDIRKYVEGCESCQRTKPKHTFPAAPLHPNQIPTQPWEHISVDIIGPIPESAGNNAILVIVDRFSKMIKVIPTSTGITSLGVARCFRDHVFRSHGIPRKVISDRGSNFVSAFMRDFYKLLEIESNASTAYHPQTDGQTERINQEIEHYLRVFCSYHQSDWSEWLPLAEFSYNDKTQMSTGHSPFFLNYGFHPRKGTGYRREVRVEAVQEFADRMRKTRAEAESALKKAAEDMKQFYDRKRSESYNFKIGDRVWLEATNISSDQPMKKLDDKRYGPFKILSKHGESAYKLALPVTWKSIHPVFNECVLSPFKPAEYPSQRKPPPPPSVSVDGYEEQEVEEILDSRLRRDQLEYLVHWKGYPREEQEWLKAAELQNAPQSIAEFHRKHPAAPRPMPVMRLRFQALQNFTILNHVPRRLFNWEDGTYERNQS